jgi:hypothetical protein
MTKEQQRQKRSFEVRRRSRTLAFALFLCMFIAGYNLTGTGSVIRSCEAAVTSGPVPHVSGGNCGCTAPGVACDDAGTASTLIFSLEQAFNQKLSSIESGINSLIDTEMSKTLARWKVQVYLTEQYMIYWWKTMWSYNLLPSMQAMTRQLNIDLAQQNFTYNSNADATGQNEVNLLLQKRAFEDRQGGGSEKVCTVATIAGGQGRAANIGRSMRIAWEKESLAVGLNNAEHRAGSGAALEAAGRISRFRRLFCDPDSNGGINICQDSDPEYYNADVEATKKLYGQLTINVKDKRERAALDSLMGNLVGVPYTEPLKEGVIKQAGGQQTFLGRRNYLARYAAVRTVPQIISGWRMPGSRLKDWVDDLRQNAGLPEGAVSKNPSYKEIMHAMSIDRFDSGKYAAGMITDETKIQMERLTLSAFYLMQLRDYYELLERTALVLSVEVSTQLDKTRLPNVNQAVPVRAQ